MFGKSKRPKDTMSVKDMTRLDKRPLKYVTMRDPETYKEVRLGENGAVNIMDGDFVLVCLGRDVMRCDLTEVRVGELMNLSGITVKGIDKGTGKEMSVIAHFGDKFWCVKKTVCYFCQFRKTIFVNNLQNIISSDK